MTCSVVKWLPLFGKPKIAEIVIESLNYMQSHDRMKTHAYVIMENHIHLIASSSSLGKEIGKFKSYTARMIIDHLQVNRTGLILKELEYARAQHKKDRTYQFWREGSHPQLIQSEEMPVQKIEYIHNNPVARGYVDDPIHWRYSSAHDYAGKRGLVCIERPRL